MSEVLDELRRVDLKTLSKADKLQLIELLATRERLIEENQLARYRPYPKQAEFHAAGGFAGVRERLLIAGNQLGKTVCAGFEVAMHATGLYPDDWKGRRWKRPVVGWASGVTGESTRDNPQRILLGRVGSWGTGSIPAIAMQPLDRSIIRSSHGVADAVDHIKVKHISGGTSLIYFKHYSQGREKWQGESLDFVWFDEEPPEDIYTEGLTRTNATKGIAFITFTPLLGMSNVVKRFLLDKQPGTHVTQMTIEDALHYTPEQRAAIVASYPAHEREARTMGIPIMGSGRVFPVEEGAFSEGRIEIPHYWPRIAALDFGWDHPTAVVWLAWDRDNDVIHLYDCYRVRQESVLIHAEAIKARGAWIPVAWPHDGRNETAQAQGVSLSAQYRKRGVNMTRDAATWPDGSNGVEAGIMDMLDRMQTGRLRVASHLSDWWEEFRIYHREDGKLVKKGDDLMSATRYALMMLRKADVMPSTLPKYETVGYGVLDAETGF
jgi:phage terminase large subunit-like protein